MARDVASAFTGAAPKRAALMPYVMGGFPSAEGARRIGAACIEGGADLLEVGVPFSDPLADGPVIHAAATTALRAGATVDGVMDLAQELAQSVPVVLMTYANVVLARGFTAFAGELAERGVGGLIVPDLPLEEAETALGACEAAGVDLVPLVAPTTPDDRMRRIGAMARGFLYAVGVVGTTGERAELGDAAREVIARAKDATDVPVALGFGISTPEHAADAAQAGADGVIVASRLIRAAAEAGRDERAAAAAVEEIVKALAGGLSR